MGLHPTRSTIRRGVIVLLASFAMQAASGVMGTAFAHPRSQPATPDSRTVFPALSSEETAKLEALQHDKADSPEDAAVSIALARYAVGLARRDGNTNLLKLAGKTLEPWDHVDEPPTDILIIRANVRQIDHRFDTALADLDKVIAREPKNPQARLSRAFVLATTGKARDAARDCARILPNVSLIIRETCAARMLSLSGRARKSLERLEASLQVIRSNSPGEKAFALSVAAEIAARLGEAEKADAFLAELVAADPRSVYARAAYADFLIDQGRIAQARKILGDEPHTEVMLLLRTLASAGDADDAAHLAASKINSRMADDIVRGDYSHAREYARYALAILEDPQTAFDYAQRNWSAQKEPVDARILVDAAAALGNMGVVEEVAAWAKAAGLEDMALDARLIAARQET